MKVAYWVIGIVIGMPALFVVVMFGASELGGEVVTLHRAEANGDVSEVRIWIVDKDSLSWVEHGSAESYWISQLDASPNVVLTRAGQRVSYVASSDSSSHGLYHELRRQKYGWADQLVGLFDGGGADCPGIPILLRSLD